MPPAPLNFMKLYDYAASPNCFKVRLLLAQLETEYERVPTDIFGGDTLSDEYGGINPGRRTPVLETDSGDHLPESNAILLYLAEGSHLLPDARGLRAQVHRWMFFEQSAVYPTIGGIRFLVGTGRMDAESAPKGPSVQALKVLEGHLSDHQFLVGDSYTLADLAMFAYVHVADEGGIEMDRFPAVQSWLDRVREQPGYMNDLEGFPENAQVGKSKSIYDR